MGVWPDHGEMQRGEPMRKDTPNEIKVARIWLKDWGIWHKRTHSLPPHARLATPGDYIGGSEESVELTNHAVMCVRTEDFNMYLILKELYEHPHDRAREVFERTRDRTRLETMSGFYKLRHNAEMKVFRYRSAILEGIEAQYLDDYTKTGTTS